MSDDGSSSCQQRKSTSHPALRQLVKKASKNAGWNDEVLGPPTRVSGPRVCLRILAARIHVAKKVSRGPCQLPSVSGSFQMSKYTSLPRVSSAIRRTKASQAAGF